MKKKNYHSKYIVQKNDTLSGIAVAHNMTLNELLSISGNKKFIKNPDLIYQGEKVNVSNTYKVQPGDTLTNIAANHDTPLKCLLSIPDNKHFNNNPDLIHPGEIVHLMGDT